MYSGVGSFTLGFVDGLLVGCYVELFVIVKLELCLLCLMRGIV